MYSAINFSLDDNDSKLCVIRNHLVIKIKKFLHNPNKVKNLPPISAALFGTSRPTELHHVLTFWAFSTVRLLAHLKI